MTQASAAHHKPLFLSTQPCPALFYLDPCSPPRRSLHKQSEFQPTPRILMHLEQHLEDLRPAIAVPTLPFELFDCCTSRRFKAAWVWPPRHQLLLSSHGLISS
ncbi:hypothetical protein FH972_025594 [Carpinus fangiana]|uniref:Uncharacterized protein n=1 Tax=Carpinus fangiana TaxID=176857 RepID=A0A5N6L1W4_9ROSI|nr:hypothetical protein FH972_025594 [Carpinus fangiana]